MILGLKNVIFIVATYGEGDPPDNAKNFFNHLKKQFISKETLLFDLSFTLFGVGDSKY
jgi:sulfite reductase (NADPH) flavoprotein alpha-component